MLHRNIKYVLSELRVHTKIFTSELMLHANIGCLYKMMLHMTILYVRTYVTHENMMLFVRTYVTFEDVKWPKLSFTRI